MMCGCVCVWMYSQEIDGESLLTLDPEMMVNCMNIKTGPALKIHKHIMDLKRTYNITTFWLLVCAATDTACFTPSISISLYVNLQLSSCHIHVRYGHCHIHVRYGHCSCSFFSFLFSCETNNFYYYLHHVNLVLFGGAWPLLTAFERFNPFIFLVCSLFRSCLCMCTLPSLLPNASNDTFLVFPT